MKPNPGSSPSTSGKQLELQILGSTPGTLAEADRVEDHSPRDAHQRRVIPWSAPRALAIAILVTFIFTGTMIFTGTLANKNLPETNSKPEHFRVSDTGISAPEKLYFPPIDLPGERPVIQVGIFTNLSGAEKKLRALTNIGLDPHVQKRVTDTGLKYAVLLGPLSASTHQEALLTLKKHNYPYFHRPTSGS